VADQREAFAALYGEVEWFERLDLAVALGQTVDF
jgi:hypothetical protein